MTRRQVAALCCAALAALSGSVPAAATATGAGSGVFPTLRRDLVAHYSWQLAGEPEPDVASATDPRGIKIGGSFPQNTRENNPCDCRMDELMFLDRVVSPTEVRLQYLWATGT